MPGKKFTPYIRKPNGSIKTMEFERLQEAMQKKGEARIEEVRGLIAENPDISILGIAKILRTTQGYCRKILDALVEDGDENAIKILETIATKRKLKADLDNQIKQYFLDNPGETPRACANALLIDRKTVNNCVERVLKKEPKKYSVGRNKFPVFSKSVKKKELAGMLLKRPDLSPTAAAKVLKIPQRTAARMYNEICDEYEQQYLEMMNVVRSYCTNEIIETVNDLRDRAETNPQWAARAHEVKLQALKLLMKVHNIGQADTQINMNVVVDQNQRDAAAEAAAAHLKTVQKLALPDFSGGEEVVDAECAAAQ